jgi:hypothetical protein
VSDGHFRLDIISDFTNDEIQDALEFCVELGHGHVSQSGGRLAEAVNALAEALDVDYRRVPRHVMNFLNSAGIKVERSPK